MRDLPAPRGRRRPPIGKAVQIRQTESLSTLIQDELERSIVAGKLTAGERLNETWLAERFGTSRGPIREACRGLETYGLVRIVPNRGIFVRELELSEALEFYDIRAALFGLAGKSAAGRDLRQELARLTDLVGAMDAAATAEELNAFYPLNLEFHHVLLECSGNHHLLAIAQNIEKQLHLFRRRALVQEKGMISSNEEHRNILSALKEGHFDLASRQMEGHIVSGKRRFLESHRDA